MRNQNKKPKVAVLMAVFNGMPWLIEQMISIQSQSDVDLHIYISDDGSTDQTIDWLNKEVAIDARITLMSDQRLIRGAGENFYRLIKGVDAHLYDYIAFSDQDDIWDSNKLINHIRLAKQHNADGVSSNVIAFWPNGSQKLIVKSQPQMKWDFLFESAGPGCSFLMTQWLVTKVREQLINEDSPAVQVSLHDWLSYAVCRANGRKWLIDPTPSLMYRQHQSNVIGANKGFKAKLSRLKKLKDGWYRGEVIKICGVSASISDSVEFSRLLSILRNKNILSQYKLLPYALYGRRRFIDRFLLIMSIVFFVF